MVAGAPHPHMQQAFLPQHRPMMMADPQQQQWQQAAGPGMQTSTPSPQVFNAQIHMTQNPRMQFHPQHNLNGRNLTYYFKILSLFLSASRYQLPLGYNIAMVSQPGA